MIADDVMQSRKIRQAAYPGTEPWVLGSFILGLGLFHLEALSTVLTIYTPYIRQQKTITSSAIMYGRKSSMRSLHSLNSLTRSLSGDSNNRLGALAAAASSTTSTTKQQSRYSPPRRFCSATAAAPARGVDRNVSLPRERHDHASEGGNDMRASSSDDNLSGLSGYYGLMSLSNDGLSSERSSMSSVTSPTLMQQPQDSHTSTRPRIATSKTNTNATTTTAGSLRRLASLESLSSVPSFHHHEDAPREVSRTGRLRVILGTSSRSNNSNNTSSSNHSLRSSTSSARSYNNNNNNLIEIQPGVSLPLRGAEETEQAIAAGFYVQCECLAGCGSSNADDDDDTRHLHCILDCDYFLCPDCRSITANPLKEGDGSSAVVAGEGGLGLGFRLQPQDRLAAC